MPTGTLQIAFGRILREYRTRAGFSQEGLADAAGCDRTFIGMLERGQRQPTLETLFKIAKALDVAAATLISRNACFKSTYGRTHLDHSPGRQPVSMIN